ncbi:hypothetical protein, partial [Streptomyces sp. NPDC056983]|uniref:hypothetical protein n=1 Tax=Streptomyces sp. NPDC056983 TaxID=3345987 RepID=UPI00363D6FD3
FSASRLLGFSASRLLGFSASRLLGFSASRLLTIRLLISRRARPGSGCRRARDNRYLDAAVDHLRALPPKEREHDGLDEDVARVAR